MPNAEPHRGFRRVVRIARRTILVVLGVALLALGVGLIVIHTDWGRNKIRGVIESSLASSFAGGARVRSVEGSVLGDFTLEGIELFDAEGRQLTNTMLDGTGDCAFPAPAWASTLPLAGRLRFGQPVHRMVFSSDLLALPLGTADPVATELAKQQCEQDRATLAIDLTIHEFGPEAPLKCHNRGQPVGDVITEAFEREQKATLGPVRIDQILGWSRQSQPYFCQPCPRE